MDNRDNLIKNIFIVIGVLIVCLISFLVTPNNGNDSTSNENNVNLESGSGSVIDNAQQDSSNVKDNEKKKLTVINVDTYLDLYNGEERAIVFIGRPTCGYCELAQPIVENIAYENDLEVKYLNTDEFVGDDEDKFMSSDDAFSNGFGTPLLVVISNGEISGKLEGLVDKKSYLKFFKEYGFIE